MMEIQSIDFLPDYDLRQEARVAAGDLGEYIHRVFAVLVPIDWSQEEAQVAVDDLIPVERCYHEHDCCGRFYGGRARVMAFDFYDNRMKLAWLQRTYSQNI
jgi:hypothetical protein